MEHVLRSNVSKTRKFKKQSGNRRMSKETNERDYSDFERYMTYDVLRIIFRNLNGKDLASAAMVCRSWLEAATKEKMIRLWPDWFMLRLDQLGNQDCPGKQLANNVYVRPRVGLLFTASSTRRNPWYEPDTTKDCHCSYLPSTCDTIALGNYGVIINNTEIEDDIEVVSCLFLPEISNVQIKTFSYDKNTAGCFGMYGQARKLSKLFDKEENVTCVILFSNGNDFYMAKMILNSLLTNRSSDGSPKATVWGGVSNNLTMCKHHVDGSVCNKVVSLAGIIFCGTGIATWSVIVDSSHKTKEQIEKRLTMLKVDVKLQKYSIGFMFACCGRGQTMFQEKDVESSIFKKLFPTVPLVGSFGGGEFGQTTIAGEALSKAVNHELSTVFMILTYG